METAKLEKCAELALEAIGPIGSPLDRQAQIRFLGWVQGHGIVSTSEDLRERLTMAEETNRRSEAARMALHTRVGELEARTKRAVAFMEKYRADLAVEWVEVRRILVDEEDEDDIPGSDPAWELPEEDEDKPRG